MKVSKLVGVRFKERPADCVIDSHAFSVRGGYVKQVSNGIFSLYSPMKKVTQNIERIIREEMDALDSQEVMFPVVLPGSLWEESGRYQSVGDELLRFKDRNGTPMVLGMTHEEAAVHLARDFGRTYQNYPFSIYQIQTKYRDEARPRAGLIRVREFTMKDALAEINPITGKHFLVDYMYLISHVCLNEDEGRKRPCSARSHACRG